MPYDTLAAPYGANFCTTKAGLTGISGAATTYSTGATAQTYAVKGKAYTKAQVSGGATATTDVNTGAAFLSLPINKGSVFVFCLNAAGTVGVAQGTTEALDASGSFIVPPQFPPLPDTYTAFSYVVVKNGASGAAWTFSSGNWNATGIGVSVQDVLMLPARPQVA